MKRVVILPLLALLATACSTVQTPISANPAQDVQPLVEKVKADLGIQPGPASQFFSIADGIKEAKFNLDSAVRVGITNPRILAAQSCINGVAKQFGLDGSTPPAESF